MDAPLRYYGFLQIYSTSTWRTGLAHAWTVCVEMVFYLLLPLIAVLGARMWATSRKVTGELAILLAIGVLSVMLRAWVFATPDRLAADFWMVVSPLCTVAYFAAGMALALASVGPPGIARLRRVLERLARRPALCWGVAAAIYVAGARYRSLFPLPGASEYLEFLAVALLLVLPAAFPHALEGGLHRFLRWRPVALLGVISYGVYLWHGPMLSLFYARGVLDGWDVSRHAWSLGLLVLASSLLAGALSYVIVERPALAYKHRRRPASADAMSPPVDLERRA
jgi:peptidoglycan/LPS O-acetylase OafA/YrhL